MRKKLGGIILAMSMVGLTACGAASDSVATETPVEVTATETPTETSAETSADAPAGDMMLGFVQGETEEPVVEATPEPTEEPVEVDWYQEMREASLLTAGTNGRMDGVIERMQAGEEVTVVAIGGSVTEGAGASSFDKSYADKFVDGLAEMYPDATVNYLNVGFSGTPSSLGVIRYDHDVTEKLESNPDLVIIEFAVNDWQEETKTRACESMIKSILEKDEKTAVVLMFAQFRNKWNLEDDYTAMGKRFGIPMVSVKKATVNAFKDGNLTDSLFFYDEYHPTTYGHKIMADCLLYMVEAKAATLGEGIVELDTEAAAKAADFTNMHMLESTGDEVTAGGFSAKDTEIQGFQRTGEAEFANNWMHTADTGKKSLKATLTCKNILIDYKTSNKDTFGKASIYVDGELVREVDGYSAGGWNNSNVILVLDEKEVATHTLEIKMSEGNADKNFTVLTIGYTD